MILLIDSTNARLHQDALNDAYRLRHDVFVEEMGWNALRRSDGLEKDAFDDVHAVHMLLYDGQSLIGYQRMLPTVRPYLLTEVYPDLCDGRAPASPSIYEWTRFAVRRDHRGDGKGLGPAGAELVLAFVEWGLARGVTAVVVELMPVQMLKFVQCHFLPHPLGIAHRIDGSEVVAVLAHYDQRTRRRLKELVEPRTAIKEMAS
jgi:acyl-homoserine lactone synthase